MRPLFITLTLLTNIACAQWEVSPEKKLCIKISPFHLIDPWDGTACKIGAEFKIHEKISEYLEYGRYFPQLTIWGSLENNKGFTAKAETRMYWNPKEKNSRSYVSIELLYIDQSYARSDSIEIKPIPRYNKKYSLSKKVIGLYANIGQTGIYKRRLIIEGFIGLGVRFKNVTCTLTQEEADHRNFGDWNNPDSWVNKCGKFITPDFNFGILIGYKIL